MSAPARLHERADACPGVFAPHDAADGALARVRLPGGAITGDALRVVADCAAELGDGRVHLTSRGNLQLRGVSRSGALPARLTEAGLLPSATHERVRNVLASPLSGIAAPPRDPAFGTSTVVPATLGAPNGGSCDVRGLASALDRELCARPGLAALPGRFLFALDDGRGDVAAEDPDLCWRAPDTLLVAGVDTGLRVPFDDAVATLLDGAAAFLALRAEDASRPDRDGAGGSGAGGSGTGGSGTGGSGADRGAWRAAELVGGPARIAAALGHRPTWIAVAGAHPGTSLTPTPRPESHVHDASGPERGFHDNPAARPGPVRRDDGGVALVVAPLLGELTAAQVRLLADAAPAVVVTPWRTIVLPDPHLPADTLAAVGLIVAPTPAADLSACAGRPGCAKALADVRADARAALGHLPAGRVHVSGCSRRCGAPRTPHVDAVALPDGRYAIDGVPRPGLAG